MKPVSQSLRDFVTSFRYNRACGKMRSAGKILKKTGDNDLYLRLLSIRTDICENRWPE